MSRIILGLAGEIASGKGTVASYAVEKYNGRVHKFSTMLRDILNRIYLEENRLNMQKLSTILRENFGQDLFSKVISEDIKRDNSEVVIVDGIRRESDIEYLKKMEGFKLVYVEADMRIRYERITKRGENADDNRKTFKEFKNDHQGEAELQIKGLKRIADVVLDNNGTLEDLYRQIDDILK
ncbi:MAG: AAA family ATPase [Candidatus Moranbacteria bacterium]|jgi:dephospho-CoA kinase|nr:AAA family ATPase [Candidatus Moranbacteria bacterium]